MNKSPGVAKKEKEWRDTAKIAIRMLTELHWIADQHEQQKINDSRGRAADFKVRHKLLEDKRKAVDIYRDNSSGGADYVQGDIQGWKRGNVRIYMLMLTFAST